MSKYEKLFRRLEADKDKKTRRFRRALARYFREGKYLKRGSFFTLMPAGKKALAPYMEKLKEKTKNRVELLTSALLRRRPAERRELISFLAICLCRMKFFEEEIVQKTALIPVLAAGFILDKARKEKLIRVVQGHKVFFYESEEPIEITEPIEDD